MMLWLRIPLAKSDVGDATISFSDGSVSDLLFSLEKFCLIYSFMSCGLQVVEDNNSWELWKGQVNYVDPFCCHECLHLDLTKTGLESRKKKSQYGHSFQLYLKTLFLWPFYCTRLSD